jgi:hypothetical protein
MLRPVPLKASTRHSISGTRNALLFMAWDVLQVISMGLGQWRRQASEFGGGAFEGQTRILGGKIEFLKRYCYLPMPLSPDFCPPPSGDSPPSQKGAIFLGIPPPGDEYPRNIAPPREGRMPQEYRPPIPLGYSPPIYAMWFIQIIS